MSLRGSLDTFALPDVLELLAGTAKTGELQVTGSRSPEGDGDADERETRVWFEHGRLAGHDDLASPAILDAVVSLLRMRRGSFTFTPGPMPAAAQNDQAQNDQAQTPEAQTFEAQTLEVGPVLAAAQAQLAEWDEIENVVPSSTAWLQLADRAPREELTLTAEQWRLIVAIGSGRSVGSAIADLGTGELPGFRAVKDMVADGLLTLDAGTRVPPAEVAPEAGPERLEWATPVSSWGESTLVAPPSAGWSPPPSEEGYGALRVVPDLGDDPMPGPVTTAVPAWRAEMADIYDLDALVARPAVDGPFPGPETTAEGGQSPTDPEHIDPGKFDAGEVDPAQIDPEQIDPEQIDPGHIGAVGVGGGEGRGADEGDEPLNRGLLLKFLSSVRT